MKKGDIVFVVQTSVSDVPWIEKHIVSQIRHERGKIVFAHGGMRSASYVFTDKTEAHIRHATELTRFRDRLLDLLHQTEKTMQAGRFDEIDIRDLTTSRMTPIIQASEAMGLYDIEEFPIEETR